MTELKSPTCRECARAKGFQVPGGVHTISNDKCANCGKQGPVSPASDWWKPGTPWNPEMMD